MGLGHVTCSINSFMKSDKRTDYVTRNNILKRLSDNEIAKVSTAEAADHLARGDQYIDLEALDKGVRRALGRTAPMGRLLPRKAVRPETWAKILTQLAERATDKPPAGSAKRKPVTKVRGTPAAKTKRKKRSA